jgi:hypothetical protein
LIGDKSLAIELILSSRQQPVRQTEIHPAPLAHTSKLRKAIDPHELVAIDIRLIVSGPAILFASVHGRFSDSARFTHDRRLLLVNAPSGDFRSLRVLFRPADIFDDLLCTTSSSTPIQSSTSPKRFVHDLLMWAQSKTGFACLSIFAQPARQGASSRSRNPRGRITFFVE